jgi:deoxyribodipyrimidine photo-lyase
MTIFWFRRDLRLEDNAGLYRALKAHQNVLALFIFDKNILTHLEDKQDARVTFLYDTVHELQQKVRDLGSDMLIRYGNPTEVFQRLVADYQIDAVYCNHDFEPSAIERDAQVEALLLQKNIALHTFKDHVIFEKNEVTKDDGKPYTVFTPYSRKWKTKLASRISTWTNDAGEEKQLSYYFKPYPNEKYFQNFISKTIDNQSFISLEEMGFTRSDMEFPPKTVTMKLIKEYDEKRNFPALSGTSHLGIHFRFGTISIREKALKALFLNETFLNELIWRDFYAQILFHFPHVQKNAFRKEYDEIQWELNEAHFQKWCDGETGYPLVDAGMRELNATGFMHNRVRMITASFLSKHLLIDWRWGEAYFAKKLLDFDLASNSGGWQWAAGCGTDAAPYFRIFNPEEQMKKFDKEHKYIKKWVPEYETAKYIEPIIDHKFARERCLQRYKAALKKE